MLNIVLNCSDSIETVLPTVTRAMQAGEVCSIRNINYLGPIHLAALVLLAMSGNLMDAGTGQIIHARPGFGLLAIDEAGGTRTLAS